MNSTNEDFQHFLEVLGYSNAIYFNEPPKTISLDAWKTLQATALKCEKCTLKNSRKVVVFGSGNLQAELMFVGEAPSPTDDESGIPFTGPAGDLLGKMIQAMGYKKEDVYLSLVVKCLTPEVRNPTPDEIHSCSEYLEKQIELIRPKVIVALGTFAAHALLKTETPVSELRGQVVESKKFKQKTEKATLIMPTFHPAYCLRNPNMKKPVWEDLQVVMQLLKA
jgi:uracil-DNA glycosylase family 4